MITNVDFAILDFIQTYLKCGFLDYLMPKISYLGNSGMIWIVIAVIFLFTKKYKKIGILMAVGLVFSLLLGNIILKPLIARPRPSWINENVTLLISNPKDFSFPSGHTLSSFISAFIILKNNKKMGVFAVVFASIMAFSRLYLYVHFPTDVLCAVVLAFFISILSNRIVNIKKTV